MSLAAPAGEDVLIGGPTAEEHDLGRRRSATTGSSCRWFCWSSSCVLAVLLRALVLPVLLIVTVVLSFFAAWGWARSSSSIVFDFPGADPSLPLWAFVFLVALGVDYNIFLMARVREEAQRHGTRRGMLRGLAVTGGVITSAGIVLAGTFSVLASLPLIFLTEIGFIIAFGVLLDTFVVRSVLVPALVFDIGPKVWWPSTLAASMERRLPQTPEPEEPRAGGHATLGRDERPSAPPINDIPGRSIPLSTGSR